MKIVFSVLFFLLTTTTSVFGQLLYKISGNNLKTQTYIFATYPLCPISFLDSIPQLFKTFNSCQTIITEMTLSSYEMQDALKAATLLPDSVILGNFYTHKEYQDIDIALQNTLKIGLDKLGRIKPACITEMYKEELYKQWLNFDENRSSEIFFQSVAIEQGKRIIGLDNVQETIYILFDREPLKWQIKELMHTINYPENEIKQAKSLLQLYKNGRLSEIAYQVQMPDNQTSVSYSDYQVFAKRNKIWAKQLPLLFSESNSFIVLNAIYLGGDKGLIALLRKMGYKVKAVN